MKFLLLLLVLTFSVKLYASEEELLGVMKREVQSLRDEFMQKYEDLRSKVTSTRKRRDICELCQGNRGDDGLDGIDGVPGQKGEQGYEGPMGEIGNIGRKGQPGNIGFPGIPGFPGVNGFPGANGEKGEAGVLVMEGSRLMMSVFDIVVHLFFWSPDQGVWGCFLRHRL